MENKIIDLLNDINADSMTVIAHFNSLCDRAKEYLVSYFINAPIEFNKASINSTICSFLNSDIFDKNLTPIEQIFGVAFIIYLSNICYNDIGYVKCNTGVEFNIPFDTIVEDLFESQVEINYKDNKYRVDFLIDFSKMNKNGNIMFPEINNLKYVIEIDGYSHHSKKEQMDYDYERENNLKGLGYTVIRFTGSQVYNKPYSCVSKVFDIIENDIKREIKNKESK